MTEFPYTVYDSAGNPLGSRRTEADANALIRRLLLTNPKAGPFRWECGE